MKLALYSFIGSALVLVGVLAVYLASGTSSFDLVRLADRQVVVRFVLRDNVRLNAERINTELGPVVVTTPFQKLTSYPWSTSCWWF